MKMKILSVVGARPNFMKAAPIIRAINAHNDQHDLKIEHVLVHTGQHYDERMSDSFFADLKLPTPDIFLEVGSGSHAAQTADVLKKFEEVVIREWPDVVIVVGDVNSTVACSLATAKLSNTLEKPRPLVAHVEAGLRSFDRDMPEEINRIVTDHLADLLFVTESSGLENLQKEGISSEKVFFVGNTMIDSLVEFEPYADRSQILEQLGLKGGAKGAVSPYALLTLHRPSNVDDPATFRMILDGIEPIASQMPIVFPVHPRTRKRLAEFGLNLDASSNGSLPLEKELNLAERPGIRLVEPLGYLDFHCLMRHARLALTDSGGIQEETTYMGVPCVTLRENTERPVTVEQGTNLLAGTHPEDIREAIHRQMSMTSRPGRPEKWDGKAAPRILEALIRACQDRPALMQSSVLRTA